MTRHFVDANGNYLGAFDGTQPIDGVEVFVAPENALDTYINGVWVINPARLQMQSELQAIQALKIETKANAAFDALRDADFSTINTFVNTNFASTNAQGRALLKVMAAAAGAYLRDNQ